MYRAVVEYVLGLRIGSDSLKLAPCIPEDWGGFEVALDLPQANYLIAVKRSASALGLSLDGAPVAGDTVPLLRDQRRHVVELLIPLADT
jgi:cellobiose phosphorylase